ncbi:MAG: zinc ribbon domain-containing protein [Clostridia bacterium]|nr:zinc ribbon domain-containing protein [Clostridia bacterium]
MNCTKCNSPVEDGALFCAECGDQFAVNEQKAKVNKAYEDTKNLIAKQLKSPIFLIVAILFSVTFLGQVISMLTGGISAILGGILPFIFMLIATIGLWKAYAGKDISKSLRQASIFDAYTRVMYTISIVLISIVGVATFVMLLVAGLSANDFASDLGEEEAGGALLGGGIVAALVVLVVFAIIITVVSIFRGIYANRRAYFKLVSVTAETGEYKAVKAPVVGSYVLGGYAVLSAAFPIIMAISGKAIIEALLGGALDELDGIGEMVDMILNTIVGTAIISGLSNLVSGGYLILSAVWMSNVHKAETANKAVITAECARLEEIEVATKEAIIKAEKKKRDEENERLRAIEAERAAAEEKSRQAQAAMQEQQQKMMQMMMQQMMQANGMNVPTAQPEEAPAEAPAEEEIPETVK